MVYYGFMRSPSRHPFRSVSILVLLVLSVGVLSRSKVYADEPTAPAAPAAAPTLGLALAGGGALGFTHLGVILVLEELGLDPQYLSGTSIGSIVGSLYAAGYTGDEMLEIVRKTDWNDILFDKPNRIGLNVGAREATRRYRASIRFDEWSLVRPAGLSAGQRITEYLDALLEPYAGTDDFSELPRPIGIVATDLVTGEEVVFTEGDLKSAVRASIGVPGVFTPLRYGGRYLVDGGWTNNLPVDVVQDLGADVVIAVHLFNADRSEEELQDVGSIVEQAGMILRQEGVRRNLDRADLVIAPNMTGYTTLSFGNAMELVNIGIEAARAAEPELVALRDRLALAGSAAITPAGQRPPDRATADPPQLTQVEREAPTPLRPQHYRIGAVYLDVPESRPIPPSLLELQESLAGKTVTAAEIRESVYRLYDTGVYEYVSYDLSQGTIREGSDRPFTLTVYGVPHKPYRSEVQLGFGTRVQLESDLNMRSVLHGNYVTSFGMERLQMETDLWITELPQTRLALSTFVAGPVKLGVAGYLLSPPLILYDGRTVESLYLQRRTGVELWLETPFLQRATLGVSGFTEWFSLERAQGSDLLDEISTRRVGISTMLHYDTLDRAFFPTRGGEASFIYRWRYDGDDRSFNSRLDYSGRRFFALTDRINFQLRVEGGSDLNSKVPPYEQYYTGGAELFEGYYYQELSGNHILTVGGDVRVNLFPLPLGVGESVYLRVGGNVGRIWDESFDAILSTATVAGGRVGLAFHTGLGEFNIGYSVNDQFRSIVYVLLGPAYTYGGNGYRW